MFSRFLVLLFVLSLAWLPSDLPAQHDHDHDHAEEQKAEVQHDDDHDHAEEQETAVQHDDDDGHDHDHAEDVVDDGHDHDAEGDEHEGHSDELVLKLTPEAVKLAGITISSVKHGSIHGNLDLPGEVGFNEDRVAHIAPRFAGIALQANFRVGDYVNKGDVVAIIESNESMNSYSIKAPISGRVIERHITSGEFVSEENSIYVIADLSTVWVNLAVYPKDAERIKRGQIAEIKRIGSAFTTTGEIEYITPIMDLRTRRLTARIVLPNPDNAWLPGSFVQATIDTEGGSETLVVEKDAVQNLDEQKVIFVVDGPNGFRPVEVIIGDSDNIHTQILSGISPGTEYVSKGAFELKAEIVTSNLDPHAGHGH